MSKFFIIGGNQLNGEIEMDCAKNAILPILAGCILIEGEVVLHKIPKYSDVLAMCDILSELGAKVVWQGDSLIVNCSCLSDVTVPNELAGKVRASIFTLGAILSRQKKAKVSYPGGCAIGLRPIDIHLNGVKSFGGKIVEKNGYIYADGQNLKAGDFMLPFASVGATENLMMLACLIEGESRIFNPAKEPEIVDLQSFLNKAGADIYGAGTNMIVVRGKQRLFGCEFTPISDRIEAGTFMVATAMCGGKVRLKGANGKDNLCLIEKLKKSGCEIEVSGSGIVVKQKNRPKSFGEIETAVYPGFPTDMQPQMMALACISEGYSLICENLFESRFKHASELIKMGGDIKLKNGVCVVRGKEKLYGAVVISTDLRGGVSLVLAGLKSEGYTTVDKIELIDRGYFKLEDKITLLGGEIKRKLD